jgi:trehalose 6-phosphate synthase/phosphatase
LIAKTETKIVKDFLNNKERLLLLDYDGTLTPFEDSPEKAKPEKDLSALLEKLAHKAEVVLISGRDKQTLEKWFGSLDINLIAEHGAWIKSKNSNWKATETLSVNWKNEIRPILELYVDRTPRSFIEEKTSSLVWHFRNVDPQLASVRAMELRNLLHERIGTLPVGILQGDKVVEVKNVSANKGRAAERWLSKKNWNFILAIGDDRTDEDMFKILPKSAFSIKVGFGLSEAQFNVHSSKDVRSLLDRLT